MKSFEDSMVTTINILDALKYLGSRGDPISTSSTPNRDAILVWATLPNGVEYSLGELAIGQVIESRRDFEDTIQKVADAHPPEIWRLIWGL